MNVKMWKYQLYVTSEPQKLMIPKGAKIRFVHDQNGVPTMWAEVCPNIDAVPRWFGVYGTGQAVPVWSHEYCHKYIGSTMSGQFVWHVYELDARAMGK